MQSSLTTPTAGREQIVARVDLHCHLLPAWDDGPPTLDESLAMARRAAESGMTHIVVTPHVGRAFNGVEHPPEEIPPAVEKLQKEIDAAGINLTLVPGAEVLLGVVNFGGRTINPNLTVGGGQKYALVESPYRHWPDFGESTLYQLSMSGITPIIAHPERYSQVIKDVGFFERTVNSGALLQITAGSLTGENGPQLKATAERLLELGWVAVISSDAHTSTHALPADAVDRVVEIVGPEQAKIILEDNPLRIVQNKSFIYRPTKSVAEVRKKQPFWKKMLGGK
jgi:protein-tyrosine phosphatase